MNPILATDSYKVTHHEQNPEGTEYKFSYIEARGGAFGYTCFFGLQAYLKQLRQITHTDIDEANALIDAHIGPGIFNRRGWERIVAKHGGHLPLDIRAIPEGTCVPHNNALVTVVNTDPEFPWLPAYFETAILRAVWYPTTVATLSRECKRVIAAAMNETSDSLNGIDFKLHDFGARGVSSGKSAMLGGMAHLVNFKGTDTLEALVGAAKYYNAPCAGFSIPAAEHSTITAWGADGEVPFVRNMLAKFGNKAKIIAVVADSFNVFNFSGNLMGWLKDDIERWGGTLVVRPDSGNPQEVVVSVLSELSRTYGFKLNSKGFKVLPDSVRVIQGDGINLDSIAGILSAMKANGWSADNIAFGMGGALLQQINRDTCKFAMKTSAAAISGVWRDVYKDPITDSGKKSKRGLLKLIKNNHNYLTVRESDSGQNILQTVYRNGELMNDQTLDEIRNRSNEPT